VVFALAAREPAKSKICRPLPGRVKRPWHVLNLLNSFFMESGIRTFVQRKYVKLI